MNIKQFEYYIDNLSDYKTIWKVDCRSKLVMVSKANKFVESTRVSFEFLANKKEFREISEEYAKRLRPELF